VDIPHIKIPRIDIASAVLIGVVVVAWAIIFARSDQEDVKPQQVGCYEGTLGFQDIDLSVTQDGLLRFPGASVPVHLTSDKAGDSFDPEERVIVDVGKHALAVAPGYPKLLRINEDGSFYIPNSRSELILFVPCAGT